LCAWLGNLTKSAGALGNGIFSHAFGVSRTKMGKICNRTLKQGFRRREKIRIGGLYKIAVEDRIQTKTRLGKNKDQIGKTTEKLAARVPEDQRARESHLTLEGGIPRSRRHKGRPESRRRVGEGLKKISVQKRELVRAGRGEGAGRAGKWDGLCRLRCLQKKRGGSRKSYKGRGCSEDE